MSKRNRKPNRKKKNKTGNIISTIILIIAVCVFVVAAYQLLLNVLPYYQGGKDYDKVKKLAEGLVRSGVPEHLSWGSWGSKCLCCGGPGVLEYFADLYDLTGDEKYKKYAKRTADKLISDSYEEKKGRSFYGQMKK